MKLYERTMYLRRILLVFLSFTFTCSAYLDIIATSAIMIALKLFVLALFAAVVAAEDKPVAEILTERTIVNPDGYHFDFKTSDGVSRQEEGSLITVGDKQGIAIKGSYSYLTPDGEEYQVTFTADDKGYKPTIRVLPAQQ